MSAEEIIRAWKDEERRVGMAADGIEPPSHPSGLAELSDEALDELIAGNMAWDSCCWESCIKKINE
jgi:mersacidin/lichenicidin family type 2 lantibiotic